MTFLKNQQTITLWVCLIFVLAGCLHTESGKTNHNRDISVKVVSGSVTIHISGHISENIYFDNPIGNDDYDKLRVIQDTTKNPPMVSQGKETINKTIILYAAQEYKYRLTTAEAVVMSIRTLDDTDAIIIVVEYGKEREYKIRGQNKLGQMVTFKN
jgi:hypothetical protein